MAKFLAVKAVVFFCFWQYCAISILVALGVIRRQLSHRSADATTTGMNDFVVCVEMAAFSVVHLGVFGWREHATDCVRGATFNPMAALGASPARSSAAWDADGGGDDQALSYDQAYRDMFFIGDVTADLGRVVREAPRVLFRGCGRVNHARKERARERGRPRPRRTMPFMMVSGASASSLRSFSEKLERRLRSSAGSSTPASAEVEPLEDEEALRVLWQDGDFPGAVVVPASASAAEEQAARRRDTCRAL